MYTVAELIETLKDYPQDAIVNLCFKRLFATVDLTGYDPEDHTVILFNEHDTYATQEVDQ